MQSQSLSQREKVRRRRSAELEFRQNRLKISLNLSTLRVYIHDIRNDNHAIPAIV